MLIVWLNKLCVMVTVEYLWSLGETGTIKLNFLWDYEKQLLASSHLAVCRSVWNKWLLTVTCGAKIVTEDIH